MTTGILSNADAILVAVPMLGVLFAGYFKVDEMIGKPKKKVMRNRRSLSGNNVHGESVLVDPDGTPQVIGKRKQ